MYYVKKNTKSGFIPLTIICFISVMGIGILILLNTTSGDSKLDMIGSYSRMVNSIFGAVLTSIALIITLASNLYTPGLVKIFVKHPLVVGGISVIVGSNLILVLSYLFEPSHQIHSIIINASYITSFFILASIIPFLFYISQFLRPTYFLPMLEKKFSDAHSDIEQGIDIERNYNQMFEYIDIISNMSLTAGKRDDRQLMRLVIIMLYQCLDKMLVSFDEKTQWRRELERFVPGNTQETKQFLKDTSTWPEAYMFSKFYHILKGATEEQDEVINEACEHFTETLKVALYKNNEHLIEMHLMIVNRLSEMAIASHNYERIQSISQYFREMIEILSHREESMSLAFQSWVHFAKLAYKEDIHFAYETYLYDSGRLLIDFAQEREEVAIGAFFRHILPFWKMAISDGGKHKQVTYRVAVKTYWELKSEDFHDLADLLEQTLLEDKQLHLMMIRDLTKFKTPLHWSFSERLLRFNYLSANAQQLANKFKI